MTAFWWLLYWQQKRLWVARDQDRIGMGLGDELDDVTTLEDLREAYNLNFRGSRTGLQSVEVEIEAEQISIWEGHDQVRVANKRKDVDLVNVKGLEGCVISYVHFS